MATRSPRKDLSQASGTLDGAAPKAPRRAKRAAAATAEAALFPEVLEAQSRAVAHLAAAEVVAEKLKAVQKAAEPQPEPPTPLQAMASALASGAIARRVAALRASGLPRLRLRLPNLQLAAFKMPAFKMPRLRLPTVRRPDIKVSRSDAVKGACLVAAVGGGWLLGALTFDASARAPQVADAMTSLATRLDEVEAATRQIQAQDLAGMKTALAAMQANVESSRAQTHMAIIEFSARVDKLDRETAARLAVAGRQAVDRLDRMDREIAQRLGEVGKAAAQTSQRLEQLEQRPSPGVAAGAATALPTLAPPAAPSLTPLPPLAIPSQTTVVPQAPPRSARAARIPVNGYVLRKVRGGVAVLEGHAGLRQVTRGDAIPGAGTVRAIEKRGRDWVVVTSIGIIDGKAY